MDQAKLVVVQTFGTRADAELAKGELEATGIQAMIQADTAGGMREHLAWSGAGFRILVREEDASAAREVLTPPSEASTNESGGNSGSNFENAGRPPWRRFS